jgi:hypothetical protein
VSLDQCLQEGLGHGQALGPQLTLQGGHGVRTTSRGTERRPGGWRRMRAGMEQRQQEMRSRH